MLYGPPDCLAAVLCMREPTGATVLAWDGGDAYLHELPGRDTPAQRPAGYSTAPAGPAAFRRGETATARKTYDEWLCIHGRAVAAIESAPGALEAFARRLGVSPESAVLYEIGWHEPDEAYSCPMRGSWGEIVGVHLRRPTGYKFAVRGSRNGIYYPAPLHPKGVLLGKTLYVVEGLSDALTMATWGKPAVGRHNCSGGVEIICRAVKRMMASQVIVIPDNDPSGQGAVGADRLARDLIASSSAERVRVARLPAGSKDLRQWAAMGATPQHLDELLAVQADRTVTLGRD